MRVPRFLLALVVAPLALAPAVQAQSSGVSGGMPGPSTGGARAGSPRPPKRESSRERRRAPRPRPGPVLSLFELRRENLFLYGHPALVRFRIEGRTTRTVAVRLLVKRGPERIQTIDLGARERGVTHAVAFTGIGLQPGRYLIDLAARDLRGRRLRAGARLASSLSLALYGHAFPVAGPFSYGGDDARFGAPRRGHTHQGQDLAAAEGTTVLAPRGGVVEFVGFQRRGAGHYVVIDGEGEDRDYAFMHLRRGSTVAVQGELVRTGQKIGEVGSTGRSTGSHLHFEIWEGGWFQPGGVPIDPLPLLRSWDRYS